MSKDTFNKKLSADYGSSFDDKQLNRLCGILIEMRNDLGVVEGMDFNEALTAIVKK